MIRYRSRGIHYLTRLFQRQGSVFPFALMFSLPPAILSGIVVWYFGDDVQIMNDNSLWSGFTFLVGFLVVFRTSQSYIRFNDGCTYTMRMRSEWYDACASCIAFCKTSVASERETREFKEIIVRLFSMLFAVALGEIEDSNSEEVEDINAFSFDLIDPRGIDSDSLRFVMNSDAKVELISQWIHLLIIENINTGVLAVPAPILSRVFQEMNSGMIALMEAVKISSIPFPFPYAQSCDLFILFHWCLVPLVASQWTSKPYWAFCFSFVQVFIFTALNLIAVEIENPFGTDANDIDAEVLSAEMNRHLSLLLMSSTQRTPKLAPNINYDPEQADNHMISRDSCSFLTVWHSLMRVGGIRIDTSTDPAPVSQFTGMHSVSSINSGQAFGVVDDEDLQEVVCKPEKANIAVGAIPAGPAPEIIRSTRNVTAAKLRKAYHVHQVANVHPNVQQARKSRQSTRRAQSQNLRAPSGIAGVPGPTSPNAVVPVTPPLGAGPCLDAALSDVIT